MKNLTLIERRQFLEKKLGLHLKNIAQFTLDTQKICHRNCENLIGATQIPLGVAGPLLKDKKNYYLPLATTEGALVASVNRGCKATSLSGGIHTLVENIGATRAPVFKVKNLLDGQKLVAWTKKNFNLLKKITSETDRFLQLKEVQPSLLGRNVYLRLIFSTGEAMGMNMVTKASGAIAALIEKQTRSECIAVTGNLCLDKKPSWRNFILGRGKKVWAEATLSQAVVKTVLKTTPAEIAEVVYRKCHLGSIMAGSLGFNAHYANIVAALFLATGQDPGHVAEASLGVTTAEVLENHSLYFSVYLPDLMVGTVGGGTGLATQKEALSILGLGQGRKNEAEEFAGIIAAAVLCGELSLMAALAAGHLIKAHEELGRGREKLRIQKHD